MPRKLAAASTALLLLMMANPALSEDVQGEALPEATAEVDMVGDEETLPQATAIMNAIEDMSRLEGDDLAQAIASLMVQFTAVMEPDEFVATVEAWRGNLLAAVENEIDSAAVMDVVEATSWTAAGGDATPVHFVMDTACQPCVEMFSVLREMNDQDMIDLRVTILPFVDDNTFPVSLGLLGDPESAWENLTSYIDGLVDSEAFSIIPDAENEDLQEVVERDYDALVGTGLRSLPLTAFRMADGEPRIVIGAMEAEELQGFITQ